MITKAASIDPEEIAKFSAMADEWWDPEGKFKPLHQFNPMRLHYIHTACIAGHKPENLNILDIGCGGGLLSEPLAALGCKVTGIDASEKNIRIASLHAEKEDVKVEYQCISAEELAASDQQFDIVLNMEILEHIADVDSFLKASAALVKPGGTMLLATLNRTVKSYALAILGAEYILRWLPRGTHNWKKFLRPSEIEIHLRQQGMQLEEMKGVTYNPLNGAWSLSDDIDVNYMMLAKKDK